MQTFAGFTTEFVPPFLSSFVSAWHWMYACKLVAVVPSRHWPGLAFTTAHRAPELASCVSSIQ